MSTLKEALLDIAECSSDPIAVKVAKEALAAQQGAQDDPVVIFKGRRSTPEGTREIWGWLANGIDELPAGTKLYAHPATKAELAKELSDEQIVDALDAINEIAQNYDALAFGLPLCIYEDSQKIEAEMIAVIRKLIALTGAKP